MKEKTDIDILRTEAEKKLGPYLTSDVRQLSPDDAARLIHELRVHQVELEMQNEELRRAQEEVERSRTKYSELYDFAPVGYFTFDKNGLIIDVNLTGAGLLGTERGRLIKMPFSGFVHRDDQDIFYLHRRKVLETGTRQACRVRLKDNKGAGFYAWLESIAEHDERGHFNRCRTAVIDITKRIKAEEAVQKAKDELETTVQQRTAELASTVEHLQKEIAERVKVQKLLRVSEKKFRTLFEDSPISLWEEDFSDVKKYIDGLRDSGIDDYREYFEKNRGEVVRCAKKVKVVNVNRATLELYNAGDKKEFMQNLDRVFNEETFDIFKEQLIAVAENRNRYEAETTNRTLSGEYIHINLNWSVAPGAEGTYAKVLVSIANITERKMMEEQLKEEARLRQLFMDALPCVALLLRRGTREIVASNQAAVAIGAVPGKKCYKTFGKSEHPCPWCLAPRLWETGQKQNDQFWGLNIYWDAYWLPASDDLYLHYAFDSTKSKKADEQIKKSLREKEVLLQEIHHRVKNNLTVISSLLKLQADRIEDERYRGMIYESMSRIKTMALVHEKLYGTEDLTNINIGNYIMDIADRTFMACSLSSRIKLEKDIQGVRIGINAAIPCGLIVNELVSNALKYAFPDNREGRIKISLQRIFADGTWVPERQMETAQQEPGMIELTISDNGVGMPEGLEVGRTDSLGLNLVQTLVRQLKGEMELIREKGTVFLIRFSV